MKIAEWKLRLLWQDVYWLQPNAMFRLKNPSPALHTVSLHLSGTTIRSMTAKNLNKIFQPANVTVIGASPRKGSVGNTVMGNPTNGHSQEKDSWWIRHTKRSPACHSTLACWKTIDSLLNERIRAHLKITPFRFWHLGLQKCRLNRIFADCAHLAWQLPSLSLFQHRSFIGKNHVY